MGEGLKPRSHEVTDGMERAPARAMLRAIGMTDDDWDKPQVGVCSSWNEVTPCNLPLDRLAKRIRFRVAPGFGERVIFRELFLKGLTLLDLRDADLDHGMTMSHVAARQEVRNLIAAIGLDRLTGESVSQT